MLHYPYPFEEFYDHVKAMDEVRGWEHTVAFGEIGPAQTNEKNSARVIEYFSDSYADFKEAVHKSDCFLRIHDYIGAHIKLFGKRKLLSNRKKNVASVDRALFRAVHFVFTDGSVSETGSYKPEQVADLAQAFKILENVA